MPNHCGNRWTIEGDFKERDKLVKFLETTDSENGCDGKTRLDFNNIRPLDVHNVGTQCQGWGTKWNAYGNDDEISLIHDETHTVYTFLTAWCPPDKTMIQEAMARYPSLTYEFLYAECGMGFYGRYGTCGPEYDAKFKWNKKHADRGADFVNPYDSDAEEEWEPVLVPSLSQFQELYDMSG
jgi:hypothetical protein